MLFDLCSTLNGHYELQHKPVTEIRVKTKCLCLVSVPNGNLKTFKLTLSHERFAAFLVVLSQSCLRTKIPSAPLASPCAPIHCTNQIY